MFSLRNPWRKKDEFDYSGFFELGQFTINSNYQKPVFSYHLMQNINGERKVKVNSYCSSRAGKEQPLYQTAFLPWEQGSIDFAEVPYIQGNPAAFVKLGYTHLGTVDMNFSVLNRPEYSVFGALGGTTNDEIAEAMYGRRTIAFSAHFFYNTSNHSKEVCFHAGENGFDLKQHSLYTNFVQKYLLGELEANEVEAEIKRYNEEKHNPSGDEPDDPQNWWKPDGWTPDGNEPN